jgi:hypothetical protein
MEALLTVLIGDEALYEMKKLRMLRFESDTL